MKNDATFVRMRSSDHLGDAKMSKKGTSLRRIWSFDKARSQSAVNKAHTHTHIAYAHRQAPANKTHAHTTASGRHCCKPSLFCACSLCPWHSLLARQQAASLSSFCFPTHFPPSLLLAHTWYILTLLFLSARSCFAVCTAFIKASGRIPAIAMGPDQLGKSRRCLRGGVGIEGANVATEGLGVRPASVNGA